jgi:hypothetical protein
MIISRSHQFIFLKTTKTAGTSFEIALSRYLGPNDIVTPISKKDEVTRQRLGCQGPINHLLPPSEYGWKDRLNSWLGKPPRKFWNHIRASELQERIEPALWKDFLKCSIVRNPFDYAVSRYYWNRQDESKSVEGFRRWLLSSPPTLTLNRDITHVDNVCIVDFMIRFERFDEDITHFATRIGLPESLSTEFRNIKAKSGVRPKSASTAEMFDGFIEGGDLIERLFEEDIRVYGYVCPST